MSSFHLVKNYKHEKRLFQKNLWLVVAILIALTSLLVFRLFYLQIFQHKLYSTLSEQNRLVLLPIEPNRGLIFDRNGVLIAENLPVFSLEILPHQLESLDKELTEIQKIIPLSETELDQFDKNWSEHQRLQPVPLKLNLTEEEMAKFYLNRYRFPGFTINARFIRHYPLGPTMVNVLGYMSRINTKELKDIDSINYSANTFIGKIGVEKYYEDELHGEVGYQQVEIDASGRVIRVLKRIPPVSGTNLFLSVDSKLQDLAQKALGNENGAVVVIKPQTGEILALVSNPSYDPNPFVTGISTKDFHALQNSPDKPMFNRAVRGQFPPGSTIKPFIALQGLDSEKINEGYTINDPGWFKLPNYTHPYRDWLHTGHGKVNVVTSIIVSCDTFFYNLANMLGISSINSMLQRFGFGKKVDVDIGEELPGNIPSPEWKMRKFQTSWYPGDTVLVGIGQGFMLVTPLQLAYGAATIAMRGLRMHPHLLIKTQAANNQPVAVTPTQDEPIKLNNPKNWNIVIKGMRGVVDSAQPKGTAHARFMDVQYSVAAKTGTVQLFSHYLDETQAAEEIKIPKKLRNHSLFIGFAPIEQPQVSIAVVAENSIVASIVARKVLDYIILQETK